MAAAHLVFKFHAGDILGLFNEEEAEKDTRLKDLIQKKFTSLDTACRDKFYKG